MSVDSDKPKAELEKIKKAIAAQKGLRGILPDEQIDASLAPLMQQRDSLEAGLKGNGAIAKGEGSQAVGKKGILARDFQGMAFTGNGNIVVLTADAFLQRYFTTQVSGEDLRQTTEAYIAHLIETYCRKPDYGEVRV